jgi:HlyD family secretion protein
MSAPLQDAQMRAQAQANLPGHAEVVTLRPPRRLHDPLKLIEQEPPSAVGRIVLWTVCVLVLVLLAWAAVGQLDIIATAQGKLVPQTLVKVVQPAEAGVVKRLLVAEGQHVKAGQVLAQLDPTLAAADTRALESDLGAQQMQARRITAELDEQPMAPGVGDDPRLYAQVLGQYGAHRKAFADRLEQEKSLLLKAEHERRSAAEVLNKIEQTLPAYKKAADAYARLESEGFMGGIAADEKRRDWTERMKDLDAQRATVAALDATIAAQRQRLGQIRSDYRSELEKELAEVRARIEQLRPTLNKSRYRQGLMELTAPQDGVVKDLATTTPGAVVQPGSVVLTLVPDGEHLYADVNINNDDVGFTQVGQLVRVKLAAYPFQKYGMLTGKVVHLSADALDADGTGRKLGSVASPEELARSSTTYKARVQLDSQVLAGPAGVPLALSAGMQVAVEIKQGRRTVLEYLLSPVQRVLGEAAHER